MVIDAKAGSMTMKWKAKDSTPLTEAKEASSSQAPPAQADTARPSSSNKGPTLPEYAALRLRKPMPEKTESGPSSTVHDPEVGDDQEGHEDDQEDDELLDYEGEDDTMGEYPIAFECNTISLECPSMECYMAFLLSSEYALPAPMSTAEFIEAEERGQPVCTIQLPEEEGVVDTPQELSQSNHKYPDGVGDLLKLCMAFAKPTLSMSQHIKPLYVSAEIEGTKVRKVLIDTGAAVSIITMTALEHLKIPKDRILESKAKVKGFAGNVTPTSGVIMLRLKIGPSDDIQALFVTETSAPYSLILGRDWIHRTWTVSSSLHQELIMWDPTTDRPVLVKADEHPFSIATCHLEAGYYNRDVRPLQVKAVDQKGNPLGVTSTDLTQWGIAQASTDYFRPVTIVLPQTSSNE